MTDMPGTLHIVPHGDSTGFSFHFWRLLLLQWPTLITLLMFPVLVWVYVRLAYAEERDAEAHFGERWWEYAVRTPRFIPQRSRGAHE